MTQPIDLDTSPFNVVGNGDFDNIAPRRALGLYAFFSMVMFGSVAQALSSRRT